jgi:hypothetical protein
MNTKQIVLTALVALAVVIATNKIDALYRIVRR